MHEPQNPRKYEPPSHEIWESLQNPDHGALARGSEIVCILLQISGLSFLVSSLRKHNPQAFLGCLKRVLSIMTFHFNTPSQTPLWKPFSSGSQNFSNVEIFCRATLFRTLKNKDFPVLSFIIGLLRKNATYFPKRLEKTDPRASAVVSVRYPLWQYTMDSLLIALINGCKSISNRFQRDIYGENSCNVVVMLYHQYETDWNTF